MNQIETALRKDGYAICDHFFDPFKIEEVEKNLQELGVFNYNNPTVSALNLLKYSKPVKNLANDIQIIELFSKISKRKMFPVKAFVLDKTLENNWHIPWHQDLKIAVQKELPLTGYTNWSVEAGIIHVQPPEDIMHELITVRLHLDPCTSENGAMFVIPGSHKCGIIHENKLSQLVDQGPILLCTVRKFGVMFMRPLLLHHSPPSTNVSPRRILQIEYGFDLKDGLLWHDLFSPFKPMLIVE